MRIAHVTATFLPYYTGTGNVCFHNARELARRNHEVHVFTALTPDTKPKEDCCGFTVHRLAPLLRIGNAPVLPQLLSALNNFDVLHLHYPFFGGELTALAARLNHIPLVMTYHQDVFLSGWMGWVEKFLRYTTSRITLRSAARLLFTSKDYGQASYIRSLLRGREAFIDELPNGVDIERFVPGGPPLHLRKRFNLMPSDLVVLMVAGLDQAHSFKGVPVLMKALVQLPRSIKAVIVGEGSLRPSYESQADKLGLSERVFFPGQVPDADLLDFYRLANVNVLPSTTMGEAFGLVLVESLACATPVIASRLPGVRSVVSDGEDGLLVKPGDVADLAEKIRMLAEDPQRRREMGQRGRAKVEGKYAWPKIGERLEAIYQSVVSDPTHSILTVPPNVRTKPDPQPDGQGAQ